MRARKPANDNGSGQHVNPLTSGATLLTLDDVMLATSISGSTIYRKITAGNFPRALRLGPGSVRWLTAEVKEWIERLDRAGTEAA